jgi:flagellin-like hook-associated protein FlgL
MAILPLQLARVSNQLRLSVATHSLAKTQQQLVEVQNQLSTGKRLNHPSDDPAAAAIAMQLRKTLELRAGFSDNLSQANSQLSEVDTTLNDVTDLLRQAQQIASANVGSDISADERKAAATIVDSIYNQILSLANKQAQGVYIFGGDKGAQPFTQNSSGIQYTGSERTLNNRFDESSVLPFMVDGNDVFGALSSRIKGTADLTPTLAVDTRLVDLRGAAGEGVGAGSIVLGNGTVSKVVDLSHADNVGDVINAINTAAVGGITASLLPNGTGLMLAAAGTDDITVSEAGGTRARDLGLLTTGSLGAGTNLNGQPIKPAVTVLTRMSDLNGGLGIDTRGLVITNGLKQATISFASATTVEDMLNQINSSGMGVLARINASGTGIDVLNPVQGAKMMIAENGGLTAADIGIRSFGPASPLSELNGGAGVATVAGPDFQITRQNGTVFSVDVSGLSTVQDVIDAINTADAGGGVTASFSIIGNGIALTDTTIGGGSLDVTPLNFSRAAADLGLQNVVSAAGYLQGQDVNAVEATGLFGSLGKLRDALTTSDQNGITQAAGGLQNDLERVVRIHGQVGAQVKDLESRQQRLDDQNLATKSLLSTLEDTDFNEAITRFQTLQTALQANLQTAGRLLNQSLLDFLQ